MRRRWPALALALGTSVFAFGWSSVRQARAATVGYWRFEEGTAGTAATGTNSIPDSSGNGNNATPFNGPVYVSDVPGPTVPGTGAANGLALSFDGTSQRVFIPDSPSLAPTKSLTLEAYLKPASLVSGNFFDQEQVLFRGDDRSSLDPYELYKIDGNIYFAITDAKDRFVSLQAPLPAAGRWTFVAGTLDDATGVMDLYVNGRLAATTTTTVRPFGRWTRLESRGSASATFNRRLSPSGTPA